MSVIVALETYNWVSPLDVEDPPKIPQYGCADRHECEQPDHLAAESAGQGNARCQEPEPPVTSEFAVPLLVEFDVTKER